MNHNDDPILQGLAMLEAAADAGAPLMFEPIDQEGNVTGPAEAVYPLPLGVRLPD